jgi:hypothetical protein
LGQALDPALSGAVLQCVRLARKERLALGKMRVDASRELWLNVPTSSGEGAPPAGLDVRLGRIVDLPEKFRDIRQCLTAWPELMTTAAYLNVMSPGNPAKLPRTALKNSLAQPAQPAQPLIQPAQPAEPAQPSPAPGPAQAAAPDLNATKTR